MGKLVLGAEAKCFPHAAGKMMTEMFVIAENQGATLTITDYHVGLVKDRMKFNITGDTEEICWKTKDALMEELFNG
jgi:hypothetical protein